MYINLSPHLYYYPILLIGSDLDGDEYHVMWLGDLTFSKDNQTPMDFAIQSKPQGLDRDVEVFKF